MGAFFFFMFIGWVINVIHYIITDDDNNIV